MEKKKERRIRLCRSQRRATLAPVLTLEGLWLQELGFNVGDLVEIKPINNGINIKVIEKWRSHKSNKGYK
ncbi:hypothetical protein [Seonamhaeicola sp.]|uniref:hypothetical protein n=1 Tax=Seonamhaeicola sp. TaxID=1912245 RepID=UPI00262AE6E8|nr:hypothetical protein [Seonamhaeicola sp.]